MIDVHGGQLKSQFRSQTRQHMQQDRGIDASGKPDHKPGAMNDTGRKSGPDMRDEIEVSAPWFP